MAEYSRVTFTQMLPVGRDGATSAIDASKGYRITRDDHSVFIESTVEADPSVYEVPRNVCVLRRARVEDKKTEKSK